MRRKENEENAEGRIGMTMIRFCRYQKINEGRWRGKKMNTNKNLKKNEIKIEIDEIKKEDVIDNKIKEK